MYLSNTIVNLKKNLLFISRLLFPIMLLIIFNVQHSDAEIRFGVTPYLSEENLKASFEPILEELSKKIGEEIKLVITRDYSDLTEQMAVGNIDIGAFSPFAYIDAKKNADVKIFASHCVDGKSDYQGIVIARRDSGYKTIDQLADKTFAFVDPKSASGFLYPRSLLIREGKNPDHFFGKTFFAGSHDKVIRAVYNKRADAGAVYSDAYKMAKNKFGSGVYNILLKTDPIPYDAYVARKDIDPELLKKVTHFFLSLSEKKEPLKSILKQKKGIQFTGWISADDSRYDVVRETAAMSKNKKKIAVFNFSASGKLIKKDKLNEVFSEITSAYLAETNRFEVVPRFQLENALLKHNINFDTKPGPKLFNILKQELDLDFLLSGNVNGKIKTTEVNCFLSSIKRKSEVYLTKFKFHSIEELSDVSLKCVSWLQQKIPVEAYIMKVTGKEIIIHGGLDMGFAENDAFNIVNLGEKIYSSDGKNIIGRKRRQVAEGIFKSVSKDTSSGIISGGNINQVDIGSRATVANALTTSSQGIYSFYLKGLHALSTGSNDEAVRSFTKVIQKDPAYAIAHARLSTAYYNLNNKTKGKEHLESARKHIGSVTFQERNYILARYATEKGDLESAKSLYMDILKKYPANTSAMHNLGILFSGTNSKADLTQARHYLNKALNINPDLTITRNALGILNGVTPEIKTDNADIVVLFDTTGSMGEEIKGMINNTEKFVSYLNENGISVRLGLISFGDELKNVYFKIPKRPVAGSSLYIGDPKYPVLTSNPALFVKHLKRFLPKGGGDAPENPFLAFEKAFSYTFRKDSRKIFLLITDAPAHMNDKIFPRDSKYIIQELKKRQISVAIIGPLEDHYKQIANETGGLLIDIKSTPDFTRKILQIGESIIHQF